MPESILKVFGHEVRKQRMAQHLSQEKLSEAIDISQRHLADIEKGNVNPSLEIAVLIIRKLNISMDNIIYQSQLQDTDRFMNELRIRLPQYSDQQKTLLHTIIEFVDMQKDPSQ